MGKISRKRLSLLAARIALCALAVAYLSPLFAHPRALLSDDPSRYHDYLQQATYDHLFRRAILTDHEFPLRTPFLGGGYPLPANPQDSTFSPFSLAGLVFGEALGIKINILLFFIIGALGFFTLAHRGFRATVPGAFLGASAYVLSGWWLSRLEWGFYFKLYFHLVPWIWLGLEKARRGEGGILAPGVLLAILMTQLGLGYAVVGLFLFVYLLLGSLNRKGRARSEQVLRTVWAVTGAFAVSVLFAAAKALPMIKLLLKSPRAVEDYNVYTGALGGYPHFYASAGVFLRALVAYSSVPNEPIDAGVVTLVLALVGFAAAWRRLWPLVAVAGWFLLICFGPYLPIDLFRPLWHLPLFHSMHAPYQLFSYFVLMAICLAAAKSFDLFRKMKIRSDFRWVYGALAACALALFVQLLPQNYPVLSRIFRRPAPSMPAAAFYPVRGEDMARGAPRSPRTQQYFNVLRNVGTIDWDGDVLLPEHAQPREFIGPHDDARENPEYRGEVFFKAGQGGIETWRYTANTIEAAGTAQSDAVLVFNQNYDPAFKSDRAVMEIDGLLAVKLPPGKFRVLLRYRPGIACAGMAISLISLAAALTVAVVSRRKSAAAASRRVREAG